jgi:NAD(P)H-dependent FMN reductase
MGKRILIILGHPDPQPERLCRALASAYHQGAVEAGHEVASIDVTRLDFRALRSRLEWEGDTPPSLKEAQEGIRWAEHLVIVFPIWLGTMPALLKAFFEQVLRPGFALEMTGPGRWNRLLTRPLGADHRDHGHAVVPVSLALPRARDQELRAERARLRRHFPDSRNAGRHGRRT